MFPRLLAAALPLVAALVAADPTPPPAPLDLHVTAISTTSVTLAWTGSAAADHYSLNYSVAFSDVVRQQMLGDVTTVTVTAGIEPAHQYDMRLSALDADGRLSSSAAISVVTPVSDTAADRTPPSAPAGLTATGTQLSWTASTDDTGVTGYDVYQFDGWYTSRLIATVAGPPFTTPVGGIIYVRARDAAGNVSVASDRVTVASPSTPPTTPPAPACTVTYRTGSQWPGGFVADVTVSSARAVDGWVLAFRFGGDQRITTAWNATAAQAGADVVLTGTGWNRRIPAGGSVTAGFLGTWTVSGAPPTAATLNGAACSS